MGKGPFKLRSQGSSFKMMGSSPAKQFDPKGKESFDEYVTRMGSEYEPKYWPSGEEKIPADDGTFWPEGTATKLHEKSQERKVVEEFGGGIESGAGEDVESLEEMKKGEEGKLLAEKRELTKGPEVPKTPPKGDAIVSQSDEQAAHLKSKGYVNVKGTNQWEYPEWKWNLENE